MAFLRLSLRVSVTLLPEKHSSFEPLVLPREPDHPGGVQASRGLSRRCRVRHRCGDPTFWKGRTLSQRPSGSGRAAGTAAVGTTAFSRLLTPLQRPAQAKNQLSAMTGKTTSTFSMFGKCGTRKAALVRQAMRSRFWSPGPEGREWSVFVSLANTRVCFRVVGTSLETFSLIILAPPSWVAVYSCAPFYHRSL